MPSALIASIKSQANSRPHLQVRLYKAAYVLLTLLALAACAAPVSQGNCFWPQSATSGCREMTEWNPHG